MGSLEKAKTRFANQVISAVLIKKFEIITLNRTIATTGVNTV
ncbi:hypothetical protein [Nostoc sp.]